MTTTVTFDAATLRRGIEQRDSTALLSLYAEDAELSFVDHQAQPSKPRIILGRDAIGAYFDDVCGRDMTHHVDRLVVGDDTAAYLETCVYPDGAKVLCASVLDLDRGLITRQAGVQAWDE